MRHFKLFTREKFKLLILTFCLAASVPQLRADVTIFVRGTAPKLYVFNTNGTAPTDGSTSWSGVQMTESVQTSDGKTWYYVHYEGLNSCSIIFNNGSGTQTENITNVSGTQYFYSDGAGYYINLTSLKGVNNYVLYENSNNWGEPIRAHCWNGSYSTSWPGDQMTAIGRASRDGNKIYMWTNANAPGMIIFNGGNGNSQTGNLTYRNQYFYAGAGTSPTADYANIVYPQLPQPPQAPDYYVIGDNTNLWPNGWGTSNIPASQQMTENNGVYTWSVSNVHLDASSIGFKVYDSNGNYHPSGSGTNIYINVSQSGSYDLTITYDPNSADDRATVTLTPISLDPVIPHYYVTGDNGLGLGGFTCVPTLELTDNDNDGIYTYTSTATADGTYSFVFANGQGANTSDWNNFNSTYRIGPTDGNTQVAINAPFQQTQLSGGDNGAYQITVAAGPVTFYIKHSDLTFRIEATELTIPVNYYVKGDSTSIFPNGWNDGASTAMTDGGNDIYTWQSGQFHLEPGVSYEYKVWGDDNSWHPNGGNASFSSNVAGTYTVTITYDKNNETVNAVLNLVQADPVYTYDIYVRYKGSENPSSVFLYAWDNAGDLSDGWSGTPFSSLTTETINGHTYYHVTYTSYDSSIGIIFNENGSSQTSDLTAQPGDNYFTYGGGETISGPNAQADPVTTYYVVGEDTDIFPYEWGTGANTLMTDNGDGTYSWTLNNVHLSQGVDYAYKVRDNEDGWYPEGDNQTFSVNVPGTYSVTVTYDANTNTVTAELTLITPDPINTVYIIGNAGSQQWAANAGILMEYDDETGFYSAKNVVLTAMSDFAFATILGSDSQDWDLLNANRFSSNGASHWAITNEWLDQWMQTVAYGDEHKNNWYVEKSGAYDIDFNPNTREVRVKRSYDKLYISYGVNWTYTDNSMEMTTVDGNIYQATITLNEGDYFLFSTALSDATAIGAVSENYEITNLMIGFAQMLDEGSANNFHFTGTTGKYIAVVNLEKGTVTLRKTADVTVTKIFLQKTSNVVLDPAGGTYQGQTLDGKRGGIYAWNKLNLEEAGGTYRETDHGPTNYTYDNEVNIDGDENGYDGNGKLVDLPDTTTVDGKQWYAWSVSNSICEFYFIRNNKTDYKSQKIMRRAGEVWLIWIDEDATSNRQENCQHLDSLQEVTSYYYDVTASGVSDCSTMLEDHYYVYYTNTTAWDSVYCYAWNDENGLIEFTKQYPGNKCTFVGYDEDGYEVWCYDFGLMEDFHTIYGTDDNGDYIIPNHVIFDNGKYPDNEREQTGDLVFDNGACYDYLGMVYLGNSLNGIINSGIVNGPKYTVEDDLIGVYYDENAMTKIIETDINGNPIQDDQGNPRHIDVKGALYAKDFDNYSAKSIQPDGTTDYVYGVCAHKKSADYPGGSQIQIKRERYDQSNWVKIVLSPNFDNTHLQNTDVTYNKELFDEEDFESATANDRRYLEQYVGKIIPGGSMSGNLVNNVNPQMHITNIAMPLPTEEYEKNVYVTANFNDTVVFSYVHQDWNPGFYDGVYRTVPVWKTEEGVTFVEHMRIDDKPTKMFYVAPKPQEVAYITWAVFDHPNPNGNIGTVNCLSEPSTPGAFYAPMNWDRTGELWDGVTPLDTTGNAAYGTTYGPYSNGYMQYGAFQVNWSLFEGMEIPASETNRPQKPWYQIFKPGQAYKILAIIRYAHGEKADDIEYTPGIYEGGENYNEGPGNHVANAPRRDNDTYADIDPTPYNPNGLSQSKFIVFPLRGSSEDSNGDDLGNVTVVKEVVVPRTVVSTRYYNLMGVGSDKPFDGLNIVVTTYSDGTRSSVKILR